MNLANGILGEPNGVGNYIAFDNDPLGKRDPLGLSEGPIVSVSMDIKTGRMQAGYVGQEIDWADWGRVSTYDPDQFVTDLEMAGTVGAGAAEIVVGTFYAPASWALDAKDFALGADDFRKGHHISGSIQVAASAIGFIPLGDLVKKPVVGIAKWAKSTSKSGADEVIERAVREGAPKSEITVFRQGTFADETTGWEGNYLKGKKWATENPLTTPDYAKRYGLPAENTGNPDWVAGGRTQGPYTKSPAPPSHNNPLNTGGATEVVPQNPNDVILDWFHMP